MNLGSLQSRDRTDLPITSLSSFNVKHIPTLTLLLFSEENTYGYEYDDINGMIQLEYGFKNIGQALANAYKKLKTFTLLPEVEMR
jgi:hypothetical protein